MIDLRGNWAVGLGVLAAVGSLVVALSSSLPSGTAGLATVLGSRPSILLLAGVVALTGAWVGYSTRGRDRPEPDSREDPDSASRVGGPIDDAYENLLAEGEDADTQGNRMKLRAELHSTATSALLATRDVDSEAAERLVDTGEWTDDPRAAAFLGESAPPVPLQTRLRDWFAGETVQAQVGATVEAIGAVNGVDVDVTGDASDPDGPSDVPETDAAETTRVTVDPDRGRTDRRGRWTVTLLAAFAIGSAGVLSSTPVLVVGSLVPLAYAVYGFLTAAPAPRLSVCRSVTDASPAPGERVGVEVTVENVGETPVPAIVLSDSPPERYRSVDGQTTACGTLEPGESVTAAYTLSALRGEHALESVEIQATGVGASETWSASVDPTIELTCRDPLEAMPAGGVTTQFTGRVPTDAGGPGLEFYSTREYHTEDPLSQVDFNYWAKTGEPRTIEFRQRRSAKIMLVFDDRVIARKRRHDGSLDAVVLGRYAATRVAEELLEADNAVGVATMDGRSVITPRRSTEQLERIESHLRQSVDTTDEKGRYGMADVRFFTSPAFDQEPDDDDGMPDHEFGRTYVADGGYARWLGKQVPVDTQILVVTPLLDDEPVRLARRLIAEDRQVRLLCPDVTSTDTPGEALERIKRRRRQRELRGRGVGVVDWPTDRPLSVAVTRAQERWSR